MRTVLRTIGFGTVLATFGAHHLAAQAQRAADEAALIQIEKEGCELLLKPDPARSAKMFADEVTIVSSRGSLTTKADAVAPAAPDGNKVTSCVDDTVKVRFYGDVAVVTAHGTRAGVYNGAPYKDRQVYYTDVFVRRDGRWQMVAGQTTVATDRRK